MPGMLTVMAFMVKEIIAFVSYIKNNAFPHPLSSEEEEKALKAMARGDTKARNKLIEHNLRLVAHIVKKFENTGEDNEDLISIGTIGLIKAIESYQMGKGTKLATYAARCVENEILMYLRSLKKSRKDVSLHDPIGTDKEGNEITLIDILGTKADDVVKQVEMQIERRNIYQHIHILDHREQEVIRARFGLGGEKRRHSGKLQRSWGFPVLMYPGLKKGR